MRRRVMIGGIAGFSCTLVVGTDSVAGQQATPMPGVLPEATAPFGLSGLALPESWQEVSDLLARLPRRVHGLAQNPSSPAGSGRIRVTYGPRDPALGAPLVLQALDFQESDFFPTDFTPGQYVAMAATSSDTGATAFGQDRGIAWLQAETYAATMEGTSGTPSTVRSLYTFAWGAVDGHFLLTAAATTPEGLAALVVALVGALEEAG